jgi:cytochrome c oxidase subunit 2
MVEDYNGMSLYDKLCGLMAATGVTTLAGTVASASQAVPWQTGFQEAATPVMRQVVAFNDILEPIVIGIFLSVVALLLYTMYRFSAKRNPEPSKTTHNTVIEVIWTVVPIMILIVIAIPSFKLLYFQGRTVDAEMTIKAVGHQWYWTYEYPDHDDLTFDALMIADEDIKEGQVRLLETDNRVVVPVATNIRLLTTADDVIHAWGVPAFGIKIDSVPGRVNETWFRAEREGVYYGQCSELCGVFHGFMPITVEVLSKKAFAAWLIEAKEEFASNNAAAITVADTASDSAF